MKISHIKTRILAALILATGLASCEVDSNAPVGSGDPSFGVLQSQNMADYFYPKTAGYTYVYKNELAVRVGANTTTTTGTYDTLKTLGPVGLTAPNGDTIYAVCLTYKVLGQYGGRAPMNMWYMPDSNPENGIIVDGNDSIPGSVAFAKPKPKPVSTDTILACLVGPVKKRTDPAYNGNGNSLWQKDTLWFTAYHDSVVIWDRATPIDPLVRTRQIFFTDLVKQAGRWQYGLWEASTFWEVKEDNVSVTVGAGTYSCARIKVTTDDDATGVELPVKENKWFAYTRGLCKQEDVWKSTVTGTGTVTNTLTRTLHSVTAP